MVFLCCALWHPHSPLAAVDLSGYGLAKALHGSTFFSRVGAGRLRLRSARQIDNSTNFLPVEHLPYFPTERFGRARKYIIIDKGH